jgi:hypothetical protein
VASSGDGLSAERALGPFLVRTDPAAVTAFARETGAPADRVPFTFPVRWLARPELQAAAVEIIGDVNWVPIHESQSFDYHAPLSLNMDYEMSVTMKRELEPSRIVVFAHVGPSGDAIHVRMEMILRIIPLPVGHAA